MSFTHLHCHSHYSLLDGLSKVDPLVERVKELGMSSLALTDHGVLYGAIEFYNKCREEGIKPIIGMEAYIAPRAMDQKQGKADADYHHLILLAKNYQGYLNLIQLSTISHLEGFYYKPRIDLALLNLHAEGLIALSGCQRGEVARALTNGGLESGKKALEKYLDIFAPGDFYLEVQRNAKAVEEQKKETKLNNLLVELARDTSTPLVATSDCHYIYAGDTEAQDIMVCIGTGKTVGDANRLDMRSHELYLKSPEEMVKLFSDLPEAIANTQKIAEKCVMEIPIDQRYFPKVKLPEGVSAEEELTRITYEKAAKYYGDANGELPEEVTARIEKELNVICKKGFASYFLMVSDITQAAHSLGAITNTRGSAAGSIVGRILEITNVDPLYFAIPFERFLTMHRPAPPDIDLDISDAHRDKTIEYITHNYGKNKVAQIITFGTMAARAAVRDVGRALGIPYGKCDRISKMIPIGKQGFNMTLETAISLSPELKEAYEKDSDTKAIINIAKKLEGCCRHASVHAAGIIITPEDLTNYVPLQKEPDGEKLITQYDMYALDVNANSKAIGAIKIDLLGIRNLSILGYAVELVEKRHGIKVDLAALPQDDKKTFELLGAGHTFGVFQLGSSGMTRYLKELKASTVFDIMAMIALYRPGPLQFIPDYIKRKHNPKLVTYLDPALESILSRTYGVLVFQDDLLTIAHDLAGYTWEEVDKFRKAVGKKDPAEMAKQREKFISGCVHTAGWARTKAEQIWSWIEPFAAYGFNKGHSASYASVSYQTAYMKANYPVEFMAAVMTAESGNEDKIYAAVEECKSLGIRVLPPDVLESGSDFTVVDEKTIRFGLSAIKNLPTDVAISIEKIKSKGALFQTLDSFLGETHHKNFNKKAWEALVKSGALDRFGARSDLLASTEVVLNFIREQYGDLESKQGSLFGSGSLKPKLKLKNVEPASDAEVATWEKEILGLYVSSHPLNAYRNVMRDFVPLKSLSDMAEGSNVRVAGLITKLKRTITRKNEPMAIFTLQDYGVSLEALVFPKVIESTLGALELENVVEVVGRISDKDGETKILLESMSLLPNDRDYAAGLKSLEEKHRLIIHVEMLSSEVLDQLKHIITSHPGNASLILESAGKQIQTKSLVAINHDFITELKTIPQVQAIETK